MTCVETEYLIDGFIKRIKLDKTIELFESVPIPVTVLINCLCAESEYFRIHEFSKYLAKFSNIIEISNDECTVSNNTDYASLHIAGIKRIKCNVIQIITWKMKMLAIKKIFVYTIKNQFF